MSNLYSGSIDTAGVYKTLAELAELTITQGNTYTIQIMNLAYVREGTQGKGFCIFNNLPFQYTAGADDLYIKTEGVCSLNIAG